MTPSRRESLTATALNVFIGGVLLASTIWVWRGGWLQSFDLKLRDEFIKCSTRSQPADSPVVIIGMTEDDITGDNCGWPISDANLARLLDTLSALRPVAIGVDLFRDLPVPCSGAELSELNRALLQHTNVVMIQKLGDASQRGVPPPPILKSKPERIGANDFVPDADAVIRRGFLYLSDAETNYESLTMQLACRRLAMEGIFPEPSEISPGHLRLGKADFPPLKENDGAYAKMDAAGYQVLLDFRGPGKFASFSLREVFGGKVRSNDIAGKVVIIGVTAVSVKDQFATPLRPDQFGVELHGHFVDQLVRVAHGNSFLMRFIPESWEKVWITLWCALGVAAGWRARSPWEFFFALFCGVGMIGGFTWLQLGWNRWVPAMPSMVVFILTSGFVFVVKSYRERGERLLLMTLFSKHVSPEIARRIWQQRHEFLDGNRPKAQSLTATVFFSDMRGFTTVAEALGPVRLIEWLNEYMEVMSTEILKRGGVINEYAGDGIMATFGIPVPRTSREEIAEDATQAIDSALAMASVLKKLNERWVMEKKPPIGMRVGIFTGELVSGSLGSRERMKYTVIGDTVNTASRLESFDKDVNAPESPIPDCRILVGPSTWELVRAKFHGKQLGSFRLKGREHETTITQIFSRIAS